jgi:hypothetical protein
MHIADLVQEWELKVPTVSSRIEGGVRHPATTAETDIAMDIDDDGVTTDEDGELVDYNEDGWHCSCH